MALKLWFKDSKLVFDSSGNLVFCDDCPCDDVPSTCPCSPWPPAAWPCVELLQVYSCAQVSWTNAFGTDFRTKGAVTLTASTSPGSPCQWYSRRLTDTPRLLEYYDEDDAEWKDVFSVSDWRLVLRLFGSKWQVYIGTGGIIASATKAEGSTPVGAYPGIFIGASFLTGVVIS
jgi:hypothetical protein